MTFACSKFKFTESSIRDAPWFQYVHFFRGIACIVEISLGGGEPPSMFFSCRFS